MPGNNALSFRGVNNTTVIGQALSATAAQITVRVPAGADTGPITLTNARGSAQSPTFTVAKTQGTSERDPHEVVDAHVRRLEALRGRASWNV